MFWFSCFFLLAGCSNPPYRGIDVCGADELVIDSYEIQEGKFAILQLEGQCFGQLDDHFLCEYKDVIQEGDLLQIELHHPTRSDLVASVSTIGQRVGYQVIDGQVQLPLVEGVKVSGLSLAEARATLTQRFREEIHDTDVFLSYRDRTRRKVELMGMVSVPSVPVDGQIRLFEVLSLAQVPPMANFFKSYVVRDGCLLPVDLYKLVKEGDMCQNIVMRGGDKIYIADPVASSLMVLGEVNQQKVVPVPDGFLTLRQALAEAGGISLSGDKRFIQVIRGSVLHPKIYTLHWDHVVRLPSTSLLLIPGDIVYVAATPIAEWNRFVNYILPTLVGYDLLTRSAKNVGITLP